MPESRTAQLTRRGSFAYWLYRRETGDELTVKEFVDNVVCGKKTATRLPCKACGELRRLHAVFACSECLIGTVTTC